MHGPTTITLNFFDEMSVVQRLKVGLAKIFYKVSLVFELNDFCPQKLSEWSNIT
jgi:hypothetical protein